MKYIEELMQVAADGAATPEQRIELQRILATDPEARAKFESLQSLVRKLDSVPMADPPGITNFWNPPAVAWQPRRPSRRWFAIGYAAAAALIIAIAIQHAMVPGQATSASMAPIEEQWRVAGRAVAPTASVTVRTNGDEFVVEIRTSLKASMQYDPSKLVETGRGRYRRAPGASGKTVIRFELSDHSELKVPVDLD